MEKRMADIKIPLFPLLSKPLTTGMGGITFTLSGKTTKNDDSGPVIGQGGNKPISIILTGPVSVTSSQTSNGCF
jgi:hypothetical protein